MIMIGLLKETAENENRVGLTPESVRKLKKKGYKVAVEKGCGQKAGFPDELYLAEGAEIIQRDAVLSTSDIVLAINKPQANEIPKIRKGSLLIGFLEPYNKDGTFEKLASAGVDAVSMELIPRTSRAQSMDALSSQANIAGYRAVIEGASQYGRFFPLMMTSAGSSKPAKVMILGAGVAGLQAIATAKRLGAVVEAYDIRTEVKEQIQSLGGKLVEFDLGEEGAGQGGYARELSEAGKKRQQQLLTDKLKKCDVIISTANVPGRRAPVLITEEAVKGMRPGSVIVDMAAGSGGNCPLTRPGQVIQVAGVTLVGYTNYPSKLPADSSAFYGNNLISLLDILVETDSQKQLKIHLNLEDDIVAAALVTYRGDVRK